MSDRDERFNQLVRDMSQPAKGSDTMAEVRQVVQETLADRHFQEFAEGLGWCLLVIFIAWRVIRWFVRQAEEQAKREEARREQLGRVHGSARWMTADDIKAHKMEGAAAGEADLIIGLNGSNNHIIYFGDNGHMLTFAPTGAGKGVSAVIPNLLMYPGSVVVIDPKGENAFVTARRRKELGQAVHILDPFGKVASKYPSASFNPLDWIDVDDDDAAENIALLAEALAPADSKSSDPFWNNEGRAVIAGLLLHIAAHEPPEKRNLGRLRELLSLAPTEWRGLLEQMGQSENELVRRAGNRIAQKPEKEMASVLSTAQSHTHFLDSPKVQAVLSKSTVDFRMLKKEPASIYLVLPADQLQNQGRWLRLMITSLLRAMTWDETPAAGPDAEKQPAPKIIKPKHDVLFLLDEFAALGHLSSIKTAFGLMRGYGLKLWPILQDLPQLQGLYKDDWQTFIANAGAIQVFGTNDRATAEYVSKMIGTETVDTASKTYSQAGASESMGLAGRPLMMPDEVMRIEKEQSLVLLRGMPPLLCRRIIYHRDGTFTPHKDDNPYVIIEPKK